MAAYRYWKLPDGSRYAIEDMPDCCRREAEQTTSYEAEFDCPVCGDEWRAA